MVWSSWLVTLRLKIPLLFFCHSCHPCSRVQIFEVGTSGLTKTSKEALQMTLTWPWAVLISSWARWGCAGFHHNFYKRELALPSTHLTWLFFLLKWQGHPSYPLDIMENTEELHYHGQGWGRSLRCPFSTAKRSPSVARMLMPVSTTQPLIEAGDLPSLTR